MFWCFFAAGGGHGSYVPAIVCFPFAMLLSIQVGAITLPFLALALAQFPFYGAVLAWAGLRLRPGRVWLVLVPLHVATALATLALARRDHTFWP